MGQRPLRRRLAPDRDQRGADRPGMGDHERRARAAPRPSSALCACAPPAERATPLRGTRSLPRAASNAANSSGETRGDLRRTGLPSQLPRSDSIRSSSTVGATPIASATIAAVWRARSSGEHQIAATPRRWRCAPRAARTAPGRPATAADRGGRGSGRARCRGSRRAGRAASTRPRSPLSITRRSLACKSSRKSATPGSKTPRSGQKCVLPPPCRPDR